MKNFNEYDEFKPSDIIEGLNEFYRKVGERRRFETRYGLSCAAGPFLIIKRRCGDLKITFYDSYVVEEAITYLREECDIFYTPGMKWDDLKYKLPTKACEKEFGTTDIREMYPRCLVKPRTSKMGWTDDDKEALEALRTLYYDIATRHERALERLDDPDVDWPGTSYMVEYIRKRFKTAEENVQYLCKENDDLQNQVRNLKDLINQIHEDSDI